jgi:hypothetical protein
VDTGRSRLSAFRSYSCSLICPDRVAVVTSISVWKKLQVNSLAGNRWIGNLFYKADTINAARVSFASCFPRPLAPSNPIELRRVASKDPSTHKEHRV